MSPEKREETYERLLQALLDMKNEIQTRIRPLEDQAPSEEGDADMKKIKQMDREYAATEEWLRKLTYVFGCDMKCSINSLRLPSKDPMCFLIVSRRSVFCK